MADLLGPRSSVIDLGTGDGRLLHAYIDAHPGTPVLGVDVSLERARRRHGLQFWQHDALDLPSQLRFGGVVANLT